MTIKNNTKEPVTKEDLIEVLEGFKSEIVTTVTKKIETEIDKLATATKKGFDEVHEKFQVVNKRLDRVEHRLDRIEGRLEHIEQNHGGRLTIVEAQMKMVYPK